MNEMHIALTCNGIIGALLFVGVVVVTTIKLALRGGGGDEPAWDLATGREL